MKRKIDVNNLSDIPESGYFKPSSHRFGPQLLSQNIVSVIPTSTPQGIYFALRYLYGDDTMKEFNPWKTESFIEIKPRQKIHFTPEEVKIKVHYNWCANPGKNESRKKHKFYK